MVVSRNMRSLKKSKRQTRMLHGLTGAMTCLTVLVMSTITAKAATLPSDIVTVAGDLYADVLKIATPIAIVSFVVALLVSLFSHNQRAVDTSRGIAKGVLATWLVIMIAGAIFNYAAGQADKVTDSTTIPTIDSTTTTDSNQNSANQ